MGPRPNGRGKVPGMQAAGRRGCPRQWGRGQTAAERACPHRSRTRGRPVNGAAAKRPRKVGRGICGDDFACRQWGRGQTAAESPQHGQWRPAYGPSMGPRPNGRGKSSDGRTVTGTPLRQWGRGQTAAERPDFAWDVTCMAVRQWGRGQTAAERESWGWHVSRTLSVNGAAAKRPRKACRAAGGDDLPWPSMGPRPNGRGKGLTVESTKDVNSRQWGRGQTAAERLRTAARW